MFKDMPKIHRFLEIYGKAMKSFQHKTLDSLFSILATDKILWAKACIK